MGLLNLKTLENIQDVYIFQQSLPSIKFLLDTEAELQAVYDACQKRALT